MQYKIAEKFKSIQGEGVYAGTPMAFIRFVGCSVGKKICQHCDTMFEEMLPWQGGGEFTAEELIEWAIPYHHICLTGGEPLDQDLLPLDAAARNYSFHIETSGTKPVHEFVRSVEAKRNAWWICVSPKPGFREDMIAIADEVKVIVPGLGTNASLIHLLGKDEHQFAKERRDIFWPTPDDALRWAAQGKIVFLQPRNGRFDIDKTNLMYCQDFIRDHPELRLSVQLHKILKVQ